MERASRLSVDQRVEGFQIDRLDDVVVESVCASLAPILILAVAGQRDEGDLIQIRRRAQLPRDFKTAKTRQSEVEQDDVRVKLARLVQHLQAMMDRRYRMAREAQRRGEHVGRIE